MGCIKLHVLDERYKRTGLRVSRINKRLTLNNCAENTYSHLLFGEVFIEERNNTWNTPYLFNAKELDEETGLYYVHARYYDPRVSIWLSTDPLQEKYPNISTYVYCVQNPVKLIDPTGKDWIVAKGTYNYQWRDDINAKSTMPKGYQYVGTTPTDIINHMGVNYDFPELKTNDVGMVAMDAELGRYAVAHWVNVREKSNANITANISFDKNNITKNNSSGMTFNGLSVNIFEGSRNSGVDGDMMGGGIVSVQYGNKTYNSTLKAPEGSYVSETGTTVTVSNINIPKSDLSANSKFTQIQIKGNWFIQKPEGRTPVVRHALLPYPISFKHTWTFKK